MRPNMRMNIGIYYGIIAVKIHMYNVEAFVQVVSTVHTNRRYIDQFYWISRISL